MSRKHPQVRYIDITTDLIPTACFKDSRNCLVAEAIKRQYPYVNNVSVDVLTVKYTIQEEGKRYVHFTPGPIQKILLDFDNGVPPATDQQVRLSSAVQEVDTAKRTAARREREKKQGDRGELPKKVVRKGGGDTSTVVKIGGKTPATSALSNSRSTGRNVRTFGSCSLTKLLADSQ